MNTNTRMTRSASDKVIGGVAGGLSQYFGVDPVLIRLGFVFMTLASGLGLVLYAALWLVLPVTGGRAIFEQAVQGVQNGVNQVSNAVSSQSAQSAQPRYDAETGLPLAQPAPAGSITARNQKLGIVLVGLGGLMLASMLDIGAPAMALAILGTGIYLLRKN